MTKIAVCMLISSTLSTLINGKITPGWSTLEYTLEIKLLCQAGTTLVGRIRGNQSAT